MSSCRRRAGFPSGDGAGGGWVAAAEENLPPVLGSAPYHICSRSCCVAFTRSKRCWSVVFPRGHPGTAIRICCTAAVQHERNHRVTPLEAALASTRQAASVPFLLVFFRKLAASYIVFCSPESLAHEQLPMLKSTFRGVPETRSDALLSGLFLRANAVNPNSHDLSTYFYLSSLNWFVCSPTHVESLWTAKLK